LTEGFVISEPLGTSTTCLDFASLFGRSNFSSVYSRQTLYEEIQELEKLASEKRWKKPMEWGGSRG
jgi:hypothetical protein